MADYKVPATPEAVAAQKARDEAAAKAGVRQSVPQVGVARENTNVGNVSSYADVDSKWAYPAETEAHKAAVARKTAADKVVADKVSAGHQVTSADKAEVAAAAKALDSHADYKSVKKEESEAVLAAREHAEDFAKIAEAHKHERFILVDANKDGIFESIEIVPVPWRANARRKAEAAKYAPYFAHITAARDNAAKEFAGKSAVDMAATETVILARAKASWKGEAPPETLTEKEAVAAAKEAADLKAAIAAEVARPKP